MLDLAVLQPTATLRDVGLRELRELALLSQRELAEKAGVTQATIAGIETGRTRPYPETLRKLATALDVPPSALAEHLRTPRRQRRLPDL